MNAADLAALVGEHASRHSVPGAAIGVLRHGVVTTATYGVADVRTGTPITPETRFSAGSLTKSMVATVIARLADGGILSLDDPVAAHVPELRGTGWAERSTVRDLLANRSRIPLRSSTEFGFDDHSDVGDGALAELVAEVRAGPAGPEVWSYSNVGWCVLGRVIEIATGQTWEVAMHDLLFVPTGMRSTSFGVDLEPMHRAMGHEIEAGRLVPVEPSTARAYGPAGTTLVTTVPDLLRFAALHLEDPSLSHLRDVHADVTISAWLDAWCLGWARFDWGGCAVWGWDGLIDGERSVLRILPDRRAAVVLATNGSTGRAMYRSLFAELMARSFGIEVPPLRLHPSTGSTGDLARFAGTYGWPDRRREVVAMGGGLRIRSDTAEVEALPIDARTFVVDPADPDNPTVTFGAFDSVGRPSVLYLMLWGLPREG